MLENALILGGSRRHGPAQTNQDFERTQSIVITISLPYSEDNDRATAGMSCQEFCNKIQTALVSTIPNLTTEVKVTRNPNWRKL